jgi:hypothetical protein
MKKVKKLAAEELRSECKRSEFETLGRGKHVVRLQASSNAVILDPEVAGLYPNAAAVNAALRYRAAMSWIYAWSTDRAALSRLFVLPPLRNRFDGSEGLGDFDSFCRETALRRKSNHSLTVVALMALLTLRDFPSEPRP